MLPRRPRNVHPKIVILFIIFAIIGARTGHAAWVQYDVNTFNVVGAFELQTEMHLTDDTAPLEIPGVTKAQIVWPAPSSCATGRQAWTRVTSPGELPLILNPTLIFFRCVPVANLQELRAAALQALDRAAAGGTGLRRDITTDILSILAFAQNACDGNNSTNCNTIRSNNATIGAKLGTLMQVIALQDAIASIYSDFTTVKTAQGW